MIGLRIRHNDESRRKRSCMDEAVDVPPGI